MLEGNSITFLQKTLKSFRVLIYSNGDMLMDRRRRMRGMVNVEVKIDFREEQESTLGKKFLVLIKLSGS